MENLFRDNSKISDAIFLKTKIMMNFLQFRTALFSKRATIAMFKSQRKKNFFAALMTVLSFFVMLQAHAVTYYSRANGDWKTPATWSTSSTGTPTATAYPGSSDIVYIQKGHSVTMAADASCSALTINAPILPLTGTSLLSLANKQLTTNSLTISSNAEMV